VIRVVFDSRDAHAPDLRGWGRYARELARALNDVPELELVQIANGWPGVPELAFEQFGLAGAARRAGGELLHVPNCFLPLRRGGLPGVVTIHDLAFEVYPEDFAALTGRKFRWATPRAARSAEAVIVPSGFTASDVIERYGVDPARVYVVPEAPALAQGTDTGPSTEYLLGVGDLRAKKNWERLVTAWRRLREEEDLPHELIIAGVDAGEKNALRAAAGSHPLALPGYVSDAVLDGLIRGADALVHPSLYEGFGLVVLEAMVRGTPVAAARGTSLTEAGGEAAVYFDPHSVEAIGSAILEVLANREDLRDLGHTHAAAYTWEKAAAATADVYRRVLGA
jgi:glycosyltransferase involved in cell wall biosynthesis